MVLHKVEVVQDDGGGDLWLNKSCASNRVATGIVIPEPKKGEKKQWYIYLGGGAVGSEQSRLLSGAV
eukprot:5090082-Lingulodinium_polyedra.AAC.1